MPSTPSANPDTQAAIAGAAVEALAKRTGSHSPALTRPVIKHLGRHSDGAAVTRSRQNAGSIQRAATNTVRRSARDSLDSLVISPGPKLTAIFECF